MIKPTRVHLLRHGQVEGFEEHRYNGQADIALTPYGRQQSAALAGRLRQVPVNAIYSSDLQRCRYLADQVALLHEAQSEYLASLRELNIGCWEGLTWRQLEQDFPETWQARLKDIVHVAPPEGESLLQLAQRIRPVMADLVARHYGDNIVIAAHGGVNRVILLDAIGAPLTSLFNIEQDYACHNIIDYYPDGVTVVKKLNG